MALERTLSIIKPDATARYLVGGILRRFEEAGFRLAAGKLIKLTPAQAEGFYAEHQGKDFFAPLCEYMCSGPVFVSVLEKDNAVQDYRDLIGVTNPEEAKCGTIRQSFAESKTRNSVHGSDSIASAEREIAYFFSPTEIF